jgi:hypothetical protein
VNLLVSADVLEAHAASIFRVEVCRFTVTHVRRCGNREQEVALLEPWYFK